MKKTLLMAIVCGMFATGVAYGQFTQSISFNDNNGTPNSGTYNSSQVFNVSVVLSYSGYNAYGLSYWLEVPNGLAGSISITGYTYMSPFDDPQQGGTPALFNSTAGASAGYMAENRDLGATINSDLQTVPSNAVPPGTYTIASIQFTLNGAAPGTYILHTTTLSPKISVVTNGTPPNEFEDEAIPQASYTIQIIPEPSTLALIGLTAVGGGYIAYRRRRTVRS